MSTNVLELLGLAAKLKEIHSACRSIYTPEEFDKRVALYETRMRDKAFACCGSNLTSAAISMAKECKDERESMLILAVAVELIERDKKARSA